MMKNKILLILTAVSCTLAQGMDGREASPQAAASPKAQRILGGHGVPAQDFEAYKQNNKRHINSLRGTISKQKAEVAELKTRLEVLSEKLRGSEEARNFYKTQLEALQAQHAELVKRTTDKDTEQAKALKTLVSEVRATRAASVEQEGRLFKLIRESVMRPDSSVARGEETDARASSVMSSTSVVSFAPGVKTPSDKKLTRSKKDTVVKSEVVTAEFE